MDEVKFKDYCRDYVRYSAILEHLNKIDASWGERRQVVRELERLRELMKNELEVDDKDEH